MSDSPNENAFEVSGETSGPPPIEPEQQAGTSQGGAPRAGTPRGGAPQGGAPHGASFQQAYWNNNPSYPIHVVPPNETFAPPQYVQGPYYPAQGYPHYPPSAQHQQGAWNTDSSYHYHHPQQQQQGRLANQSPQFTENAPPHVVVLDEVYFLDQWTYKGLRTRIQGKIDYNRAMMDGAQSSMKTAKEVITVAWKADKELRGFVERLDNHEFEFVDQQQQPQSSPQRHHYDKPLNEKYQKWRPAQYRIQEEEMIRERQEQQQHPYHRQQNYAPPVYVQANDPQYQYGPAYYVPERPASLTHSNSPQGQHENVHVANVQQQTAQSHQTPSKTVQPESVRSQQQKKSQNVQPKPVQTLQHATRVEQSDTTADDTDDTPIVFEESPAKPTYSAMIRKPVEQQKTLLQGPSFSVKLGPQPTVPKSSLSSVKPTPIVRQGQSSEEPSTSSKRPPGSSTKKQQSERRQQIVDEDGFIRIGKSTGPPINSPVGPAASTSERKRPLETEEKVQEMTPDDLTSHESSKQSDTLKRKSSDEEEETAGSSKQPSPKKSKKAKQLEKAQEKAAQQKKEDEEQLEKSIQENENANWLREYLETQLKAYCDIETKCRQLIIMNPTAEFDYPNTTTMRICMIAGFYDNRNKNWMAKKGVVEGILRKRLSFYKDKKDKESQITALKFTILLANLNKTLIQDVLFVQGYKKNSGFAGSETEYLNNIFHTQHDTSILSDEQKPKPEQRVEKAEEVVAKKPETQKPAVSTNTKDTGLGGLPRFSKVSLKQAIEEYTGRQGEIRSKNFSQAEKFVTPFEKMLVRNHMKSYEVVSALDDKQVLGVVYWSERLDYYNNPSTDIPATRRALFVRFVEVILEAAASDIIQFDAYILMMKTGTNHVLSDTLDRHYFTLLFKFDGQQHL